MEISSSHQMQVFLISLISGILCGFFFDIQRVLRKKHFAGNVRTNLEDILFVLFCVFATIFVGFVYDEGAIRSYLILGTVGGALFYAALLSGITVKIIDIIFGFILKVVVYPVVKIVRKMAVPIKYIIGIKRKITQKRKKISERITTRMKRRMKLMKKRVKML